MNKIYKLLLVGVVIATFTSCTYTFPEDEVPTAGTADFTKVVAVGNSLTAGYMNGALYDKGQMSSYANIIGTQINLNGGGEFNQPDINAPDGYFGVSGTTVLGRLHLTNPASPAPSPIIPGQAITPYGGDKASLNNFGVPGMAIGDFNLPGYGHSTLGNPYFARFSSSDGTTMQADVTAANGSFFTFWLGSNDALGYALGGATNPAALTPVGEFSTAYSDAIDAMTANGAKGILANIPSVSSIPHFTTVPWNAIPMDAATASSVNTAYAQFNQGIYAYNAGLLPGQDPNNPPSIKRDIINFKEGGNGIVITDLSIPDLTAYGIPTIRQVTSDDLITLSAGAVLGTLADPSNPASVIGVGVPLEEKYTLILADQELLANRIADFNAIILSVVESSGGSLTLLDINTIFNEFTQNGAVINGSGMDATIIPPFGAFSLDGVHPNPRGSAYIASLFIDQINSAFGANIPNVNPNDWPGNELPVPN